MRGEYTAYIPITHRQRGSPPLARGIHRSVHIPVLLSGITPACAGNTIEEMRRERLWRDHPRLRGEYSVPGILMHWKQGSPPLARGILCITFCLADGAGITPACAGNTLTLPAGRNCPRDHPRLRGEYPTAVYYTPSMRGSPPLARGIRKLDMLDDFVIGITPACAGNTIGVIADRDACGDHPRLRGEYRLDRRHMITILGSPPLARGIRYGRGRNL